MLKSTTASVTCVEWVRVPLFPVIVNVQVPVGVELEVATDRVVDLEPKIELGLKVAAVERPASVRLFADSLRFGSSNLRNA